MFLSKKAKVAKMKTSEKIKVLEERLDSVDKQLSKIDGIAKHMAHVEHDAEHDGDEAVRTNK